MMTNPIKRLPTVAALAALILAMGAGRTDAGDGIDQLNGTIRDAYTGLVWLKNANCFGPKSWQDAANSVASLQSGMCGLTDNSKPGQWRLPTNYEQGVRMGRTSGFVNLQIGYYWTSTHPSSYSPDEYYAVNQSGASYFKKSSTFYVWPVRNTP